MMQHHGMRVDDFFSQDLELLLRASEATKEPEQQIVFIDEL